MNRTKLIKYLAVILGLSGLISTIYYGWLRVKNEETVFLSPLTKTDNQENAYKETAVFSPEKAPTESFKGEITAMTGKIRWQSRTATEAAELLTVTTVQQGEKLITGQDSSLTVDFANVCWIKMESETEIDIVQTLEANLVFNQTKGRAEYKKNNSYPLSVRVKNLLTETNGEVIITIDQEEPIITVVSKKGTVTAAFNDADFVSQKIFISGGETLVFNDDKRTGVLE